MQTNEDAKPAGAPARGTARAAEPPRGADQGRWERPRKEAWVPAFAVGAVAIVAMTAALMSARPDAPEPAAELGDAQATSRKGVVRAPPLKPTTIAAEPQGQDIGAGNTTRGMGAAAACRNCGIVQMVVAVHGYAQPRASGYQMHIRMDDGSTRMVEKRGALAAGSRVVVEGDAVRLLAEPAGQG
jgi:hypothetical protein